MIWLSHTEADEGLEKKASNKVIQGGKKSVVF